MRVRRSRMYKAQDNAVRQFLIALLMTLLANLILAVVFRTKLPFLQTVTLLIANSLLMAMPLHLSLWYYNNVEPILTSFVVILCITFIVFFPLGVFPILSLGSTINVSNMLFGISSTFLWEAAIIAEFVLIVGWVVMIMAMRNITPLDKPELDQSVCYQKNMGTASGIVGSIAIVIALATYASVIPSLPQYVQYLSSLASRGGNILPESGATSILILQAFLIPGVLLVSFGINEAKLLDSLMSRFVLVLLLVMTILLLLPLGGRGSMIQPLLLSLILYERRKGKLSRQVLISTAAFVAVIVVGVLYLRFVQTQGNIRWQNDIARSVAENIFMNDLNRFASVTYITNEVSHSGTLEGETMLSGWLNLLPNRFIGGERIWRTEDEVMIRKWGFFNRNHAMMLSIPGDIYFNLGFIGLVPGMALMGLIMGAFRNWAMTHSSLAHDTLKAFFVITLSAGLTINLAMWPAVLIYGSIPYLVTTLATITLAKSLTRRTKRTLPSQYVAKLDRKVDALAEIR